MTDLPARRSSGQHRTGHGRGHARGTLGTLRLFGKIVAALVSASLLIGAGYFRHSYTSLATGLHRVSVGGLGEPAPGPEGASPQHVDGAARNLLIIGDDDRSGLTADQKKTLHVGADAPTTSTDTLMIVHIPSDGARATLISIPRDSYVQIPGFDNDKINAAYIDGATSGTDHYPVSSTSTPEQQQSAGITLLLRTLTNLTGLQIDDYVLVNFLGFYNIAKAIDGVTVDLCHAVSDKASGFAQRAGVHNLTPVEALEFVRQRHNLYDAEGNQLNDLGREARQRYFLAAAFRKIETARTLLDPAKVNSLISAIKSTLVLDPQLDLSTLVHQLLDLTSGNITGQTIPTEGSHEYPSPVGDALVVDPVKVRDQIRRWLDPTHPAPRHSAGGTATPTTSAPTPGTSSGNAVTAAQHGCIN